MNHFNFKPLTADDFPLMYEWLNKPHICDIWDGPQTMEQVEKNYSDMTKHWVYPHIVYFHDKPIGYIQSYYANRAGEEWWKDEPPGTWGVDQFIGDEEFLGKGLGSDFIRQFTDHLFLNKSVKRIITDPAPENTRAIRAYEKAGFKILKNIVTPDGPAVLMEKKL